MTVPLFSIPLDGVALQRPCTASNAGRPPRNKGLRYPANPPTVQEIIAVMREAGTGRHGALACVR